ncbi:MAG: hypothetical protein ACI95C_000092 [Pseudohongiellaceae bacterium]|jgi:hypothetical protein
MLDTLYNFALQTGILGFMNSAWGWPIIESLHFVGLCLLLGTVGVFDLRMLGVARGVNYSDLHRLVPFGVAGFGLNIVTGTMFVVSAPDQYLFNPAFLSKLGFMLIAGLNMLCFYTLCARGVRATEASEQVLGSAKAIAGVSLVSWSLVIVCGRLITYYRPPYHWCWLC